MSFTDAINAKKSYGACSKNHQSVMLTVIDSKSIIHKLEPSDTLQGLAIKYGISIEKLKRANKLWFNESIHIKDSLVIPCYQESGLEPHMPESNTSKVLEENAGKSFYNKPDSSNNIENTEQVDELNSSWKENEKHLANKKSDNTSTSKVVESDALATFNEMLCKIDGQIKSQKDKVSQEHPASLPVVGYDNSYQNYAVCMSPTKQHPYLEQGI